MHTGTAQKQLTCPTAPLVTHSQSGSCHLAIVDEDDASGPTADADGLTHESYGYGAPTGALPPLPEPEPGSSYPEGPGGYTGLNKTSPIIKAPAQAPILEGLQGAGGWGSAESAVDGGTWEDVQVGRGIGTSGGNGKRALGVVSLEDVLEELIQVFLLICSSL